MAHPDFDTMLMLERRRNDLAAAENSQLIKMSLEAQRENRVTANVFRPGVFFQSVLHLAGQGLYQLGMRIQDWGCQLQVRYATGGRSSSGAPCD
jgi:hypothetical protein